jgi:putative DNA primase/helicase
VLKLLHALVFRAAKTDNATPAALFRTIATSRPTFLVDELDTFIRDNEALRGILNSGHQHDGYVSRCVGDDYAPQDFATFAPVALAAIGTLPGTILDRSIIIRMKRKLANEDVAPLRRREVGALAPVRQRITRWIADNLERLRAANESDVGPDAPSSLDDRATDNWEPLLAIADLAGPGWAHRARTAAVELSRERDDTETDGAFSSQLLADIQRYFRQTGADEVATKVLLQFLHTLDSRPWATASKGLPLADMHLARLLRGYGIRPRDLRQGKAVVKGYVRAEFEDAFARYVLGKAATPATPATMGSTPTTEDVAGVATVAGVQEAEDRGPRHLSDEADSVPVAPGTIWKVRPRHKPHRSQHHVSRRAATPATPATTVTASGRPATGPVAGLETAEEEDLVADWPPWEEVAARARARRAKATNKGPSSS